MRQTFIFLLLFSLSVKSFGQCKDCDKALEKDYILNKSTVYQTISYLEKLSEEEFYRLKKDVDVSAKIFLIGTSGSYSEFQENLHKKMQEINYTSNYGSNSEYLSYTTNPIAYKYWAECMRYTCSSVPFLSWLTSEGENNIVIGMKYNYQGTGTTTLKVKFEITQNGKKTIEYKTINAGGEIPYLLDRTYDSDGKSSVSVVVQPVDSRGNSLFNGYTFNSKYFNPILVVNAVNLEYSSVEKKLVYATGELHADDFENKSCDGIWGGLCNASPATRSCDGKFAAKPCLAQFRADNGYYFTEPNNINLVTFIPTGPGAGWNNNNFCKDKNTVMRQTTANYIEILFMGSASKATDWTVYREQFKNIRPIQPVLFYYASKSVLNFSVPLDRLNEFTISIQTPNNGIFTIDKTNISKFQYGDANGNRNFQIDLNKLKDPTLFLELQNVKELQNLSEEKLLQLFKK